MVRVARLARRWRYRLACRPSAWTCPSSERWIFRSRLKLFDKSHVVAACPMLDDLAVGNTPDVDEPPRRCASRRRQLLEQRHRRTPMRAVQCDVLDDQVTVSDEVMLFERDGAQIALDRLQ